MAITFLQKKKIHRLLILVLLGVVLVTAAVLWWGFFVIDPVLPEGSVPELRRVEVDTSILANPVLEELDEPRAKTQIPSDVGRDNPFLPSP
tara:strand:+ start:459 stop:731 length:273 start_codon:yes stop_codon:yes gene_type:complete